MVLSQEVAKTHLDLSAQDLQFRQVACENPNFLDRSRFLALRDDRGLLNYKIQLWPTFVTAKKIADLYAASLFVCNLVRGIMSRVFDNDARRIRDFYGFGSVQQVEALLAEPNGIDESIARGDFIDTADGFKCIELNFTPNVGGWETGVLIGLHMAVPATADFVNGMGVSWTYTHTMRKFFLHLLADVEGKRLREAGELNVAFAFDPADIRGPDHLATLIRYLNDELTGACVEAGLAVRSRAHLCRPEELVRRRGRIWQGRSLIHAVVELASTAASPDVYRAYKAGVLSLMNGPIEMLLSTKRNIALLSAHQSSDLFSPEEREGIRHYIPWTRQVAPGPVDFHGETVPMAELLDACRSRLVLKEVTTHQGKGVTIGHCTPAGAWSETARKALASDQYIVQERVDSLPYLYQAGTFGCAEHDVIWGPFIFGQTYGGVILRMQPKTIGGAVNLSLEATEGVVFEV